ncbi:hypothetical protein G6048_43600 [Streptomyces sp. YC419]|uniref:Integral membrane protein n=1 Tax=Streptomyces ureilyticus TaxID=1775131 RepID=A0ABX0E5G4_9ACTN|nr:hypothetical protein [Streptomyces ureilyticus]
MGVRTVLVRQVLSAVLIVLGCLVLPLGGLSVWAKYEIGDTRRYVATMGPLAAGPEVRGAVADTVTDGIMTKVEAGPLEGEVRQFVREAAGSFTGTPAFRTAWDAANRAAHDAVLRALRGERDDAVTVDLAPVTQQFRDRLAADGVPLAHRIPVTHNEITVLEGREVAALRKGFRMLEFASFWLPIAALTLAVGGILLAVHRRRAIIATALGTALGAALLVLATAVCRALTLADLPPHVSRAAAAMVYDALTSTLRTATWTILALGLTVAATVWLTGRVARHRARSAALPPAQERKQTRARA